MTVIRMLLLISLIALSGCSVAKTAVAALGGASGGVYANGQAGRTNTQTIGSTRVSEQSLSLPEARPEMIKQNSGDSRVTADRVETVVVNEIPGWVVLLLVLGWVLPTPAQLWRSLLQFHGRSVTSG